MVSDKEAHGDQKQALNIWLTLKTMNIENFQFIYFFYLLVQPDRRGDADLLEFLVFYMIVKNDPADLNTNRPDFSQVH